MSPEMLTQIFVAFFLGLLSICGALCVYIFQAQRNSFGEFAKEASKKFDSLTDSIDNLSQQISRLMLTVEKHGLEIEHLKEKK